MNGVTEFVPRKKNFFHSIQIIAPFKTKMAFDVLFINIWETKKKSLTKSKKKNVMHFSFLSKSSYGNFLDLKIIYNAYTICKKNFQ